MKRLLSFLLMIAFLQADLLAKSGGPSFGAGNAAITGTYAGVLQPILNPGESNALIDLDQNALGLFSITIPFTGLAEGVCAVFNKGEIFTGRMTGVGDPESGELNMLMEARAIRVISLQTSAGDRAALLGNVDVVAIGRLVAEIEDSSDFFSAQRIEGEAVLSSFDDANRNADGTPILSGLVRFNVDGFKQTETPTPAPDIDLGVDLNR
jgi:hypothetical protein